MTTPFIATQAPAPAAVAGQPNVLRELANNWSSLFLSEKNVKIRETGIPNNSRISVFTFYLANLIYWVGFVTGITFTTDLRIVDFIDLLTFW